MSYFVSVTITMLKWNSIKAIAITYNEVYNISFDRQKSMFRDDKDCLSASDSIINCPRPWIFAANIPSWIAINSAINVDNRHPKYDLQQIKHVLGISPRNSNSKTRIWRQNNYLTHAIKQDANLHIQKWDAIFKTLSWESIQLWICINTYGSLQFLVTPYVSKL